MKLKMIVKESQIVIPESAQDKVSPKGKDMEMFEVEEIGPGHYEQGEFIPTDIKVGDKVYLIAFMSFKRDQKVLVFGRARDVLAVE